MLSRHFYDLEEVQAALRYCVIHHETREALFWCYELLCSGCASEAISTLFEAWLWHKGPFHLSWLVSTWKTLAVEEVSEEAILDAAFQLSQLPCTDHSLSTVLVLQVAERTSPFPRTLANDQEAYFLRSLLQGRAVGAWWMAQQLDGARVTAHLQQRIPAPIIDALSRYEELLGYRTPEYDTVMRCCMVLCACLTPTQMKKSIDTQAYPWPDYLEEALVEWRAMEGRKINRRYTIPVACLYGHTRRGNMKWNESLVCELNQMDAAHIEDDQPDEWTAAEKAVSHGFGVLGPTESVSLLKYVRVNFYRCARLAWNTREKVYRILEGVHGGHHPTDIVAAIKPITQDSRILLPIVRKNII